jgi:hypothetical protein
MTTRAYLSATDAAGINRERRNALATRIALQEPAVAIVLYRFNPSTGLHEARPAQSVLLRFEKTQPHASETLGAEALQTTGSMKRELPFDVAVGDAFTLVPGQSGRITIVQKPNAGMQTVRWALDQGSPV